MRTTLTMVEATGLCAIVCGARSEIQTRPARRSDTTVRERECSIHPRAAHVRRRQRHGHHRLDDRDAHDRLRRVDRARALARAVRSRPGRRHPVRRRCSWSRWRGWARPTAITYFASRRERFQPSLSGFALIYTVVLAALSALGVLLGGEWLAEHQGEGFEQRRVVARGRAHPAHVLRVLRREPAQRAPLVRHAERAQHPRPRGHADGHRSRSSRASAGASPAASSRPR